MDKTNIVAMIPARIGSTRLKMKNLALLDGKPLISYAIEAAKESGVFNKIVINSDHTIFSKIAKRHNVEFYLRPPELGSSTTKSDDVVYDFMLNHTLDILIWLNPTSPLQTGKEIRTVVEFFVANKLDTLITANDLQVHCLFDGKPVNFKTNEMFAQTQDLKPVIPFVYSIMMWNKRTFVDNYKKRGFAILSGTVGYHPVSKESSIIIKTEEDIVLAEQVLKATKCGAKYKLEYDELVKEIEED